MKSHADFILFQASPPWPESGKNLSAALFAELRVRWPQFFHPKKCGFHFKADIADPVYAEVVAFLREHGREPYLKRWPALANVEELWFTHYQVKLTRTFAPEDFSGAKWVTMFPGPWIADQVDRAEGGVRVKRLSIQPEVIGFSERAILCNNSLRKDLEKQNFKGLHFRSVEVVEDDYADLEVTPPSGPPPVLWELWSDLQAPKVTNRLVNNMGEPYDPDRDDWLCCVDDDYWPSLARMKADDVASMEPFDFANHQEPIAARKMVSRRFYDWCEARKLKIEWHPIGLD